MLETLLSLDTSALLWARTLVWVEYAKYVQISWELIVILAAIILIGLWLKWVQKKDNRYKIWALEITFTIGLTFIFYSIINLWLPQDWRESPQVVANGIKPLIPHPVDNSFPSGHALFTAALLVGIIRFFRNKYLIGLTIIIWCITVWARVIGWVHYPVDIIGGIIVGGIGAYMMTILVENTQFFRRYIFAALIKIASWIKL